MLIDRFDPLAIVFSETPIEVIEALALEQLQIFRRARAEADALHDAKADPTTSRQTRNIYR